MSHRGGAIWEGVGLGYGWVSQARLSQATRITCSFDHARGLKKLKASCSISTPMRLTQVSYKDVPLSPGFTKLPFEDVCG